MFKNKIKEKLNQGEQVIGTFISINSPEIVEIAGLCGFDFVVIDMEHGPFSVETTVNLIRAAELRGISPITRVTENTDTTILRSLDVGSHGIQVPQVNDVISAQKVVQAAKYFPLGKRGIAIPRASDYGTQSALDYFQIANKETLIIIHCENIESLQNLDDIAKVPEIDVIFLGPLDMSQSLGVPGQTSHPLVEDAARSVLKIAEKNGKIAGIFAADGEQARLRAKQGFRFIAIGMDVLYLAKAYKSDLQRLFTIV